MKKIVALILIVLLGIPTGILASIAIPSGSEAYTTPSTVGGEEMGEALPEKQLDSLTNQTVQPFVFELGDLTWGMDVDVLREKLDQYKSKLRGTGTHIGNDGVIVLYGVNEAVRSSYQGIITISSLNLLAHPKKGLYCIASSVNLSPEYQTADYMANLDIVFRHVKRDLAYEYGVPVSDRPHDMSPSAQWHLPDGTVINVMLHDSKDAATSMVNITYYGSNFKNIKALIEYEKSLGLEANLD